MTRRIMPATQRPVRDAGLSLAAVLLVSACAETLILEGGAKGHPIACLHVEDCEQQAQEICRGTQYHIHGSNHEVTADEESKPLGETSSARQLGDVAVGSSMPRNDGKPSWLRRVVECKPKPVLQESYSMVLSQQPGQVNKAVYMQSVCKLRDPDTLREQLEIARQVYGDVSCDP